MEPHFLTLLCFCFPYFESLKRALQNILVLLQHSRVQRVLHNPGIIFGLEEINVHKEK